MIEGFRLSIQIKPRYKDVDYLGHVNNAVYLTYFEEGRFAYCRHLNVLIPGESPVSFIILDNYCKYERALTFHESVDLYVRVSNLGKKSFRFEYLMTLSGSEEVVATGYSTAVAYDYSKNETIPIPEDARARIMEFESL
ncbi:MAG TPA: acyl-CoA thioesterase [Candidatus Syntrophoarchaeum butanivorans]|uniref:Acyl-CoA thioesterase n=1 Tax=Candidatus Syntropharchaeum butanivorans TaxID=1839936 RepID=A0A1F2P7Y1_9EURY|nr:MAG: thioesterase superfamily protein [Candidatus Syntrophoarchaeum butanivorans]RJS71788.1 MAG: acyl-CoA thioesterase [Candidatus Syntrophoarchaeum sp. WYZ-LMO15]HDM35973.1 acyl-CoA thioesterase [Candidatus Syntrophoarchaeum butanivorans]HEC57700.1 acyl-CoA thioesterase [Candidatus Syntrophoarchaeum butanivorans]